MRRAALPLLLVPLSCTIIIKNGGDPPPGGGGVPTLCGPTAPPDLPVAHVFFDMRIERSTVAMEQSYGGWMKKTFAGLLASHIMPTRAVLFRLDERPQPKAPLAAWGCDLGGFDLDPAAVIEHYAVDDGDEGSASQCAVTPLIAAGADLGNVITSYPPDVPGQSGLRVFGEAPDLVVVVHFDALSRKAGLDDRACDGAMRLAERTEDGSAAWLRYTSGSVKADRVFHWFVATDEGIDRSAFVDRCRKVGGFPTTILDVLEPSAEVLYGPLASAIASGGGSARVMPLCQMFDAAMERDFFVTGLNEVASSVGSSLDEKLLEQLLASGGMVPEPENGALELPGRGM